MKQESLFSSSTKDAEPAQMPATPPVLPQDARNTPPPPVTQSDAERDRRSYAALMEYI